MTSQELLEKEGKIVPFSNGSERMQWYDCNCDCCAKAFIPPAGFWPKDSVMRRHVRDGRECPLKYSLDRACIDGTMPVEPAEKMGWTSGNGFPARCILWSDRGNGGNPRGPRKPKPVPDNQMVMGFGFSEIAQSHKPIKEKVTS